MKGLKFLKVGASLAPQRSAKRRQRRQIKRKRQRRIQVRLLLAEFGFPTEELSSVISRKDFENRSNKTLWDIRTEAFEQSLSDDELAAVLFQVEGTSTQIRAKAQFAWPFQDVIAIFLLLFWKMFVFIF